MLTKDLPMDLDRARVIALGGANRSLGQPSKMPGYSFGLSAFKCIRGDELAQDPHTACAHCYARSNFYLTYQEVLTAHELRLAGLTHPEWVTAMVTLILHHVDPKDPYFRWHDSGDLQGTWHLGNIAQVCRRTPQVRYWMPTHEPFMVRAYLDLVREGSAQPIPTNLCIRISADYIGQPPERIKGLEQFTTSTIHRGHGNRHVPQVSDRRSDSIECKSYERTKHKREQASARPVDDGTLDMFAALPTTVPQEPSVEAKSYGRSTDGHSAGLCGKCRACWDPRVRNVSYPIHGERKSRFQLPLLGSTSA
jgi:hypothetical protein